MVSDCDGGADRLQHFARYIRLSFSLPTPQDKTANHYTSEQLVAYSTNEVVKLPRQNDEQGPSEQEGPIV